MIGKTIDRPEPLEEDIQNEFADKLIPPFRTSKGAFLERTSAIQLLNRYSQTMPNDMFTKTQIIWDSVDTSEGVVVTLMLPIQSVVKDVIVVSYFILYINCSLLPRLYICIRLMYIERFS